MNFLKSMFCKHEFVYSKKVFGINDRQIFKICKKCGLKVLLTPKEYKEEIKELEEQESKK